MYLLERLAPGHHGYQRACDLISGKDRAREWQSKNIEVAGSHYFTPVALPDFLDQNILGA